MKTLYTYLEELLSTPSNTVGMGNMGYDNPEPIITRKKQNKYKKYVKSGKRCG